MHSRTLVALAALFSMMVAVLAMPVAQPNPSVRVVRRVVTRVVTIHAPVKTVTVSRSTPTSTTTKATVINNKPTATPAPPPPPPAPPAFPSMPGSPLDVIQGAIASVLRLSKGGSAADISAAMIDLVNLARAANGQPKLLKCNSLLAKSCMGHARDMSMHNDMTHTGSNGSSPADRASAVGYNWGSVAENVAEGQSSIAQVMNDWMHSPGHRANLLAGSSNDFAAAVAQALDGSLYWVQCFGSLL